MAPGAALGDMHRVLAQLAFQPAQIVIKAPALLAQMAELGQLGFGTLQHD
ncbi:MAG: hypothetical protein JWP26_1168 [Devosia sp.]|nr:hypothetical protein [Devosia sp.]